MGSDWPQSPPPTGPGDPGAAGAAGDEPTAPPWPSPGQGWSYMPPVDAEATWAGAPSSWGAAAGPTEPSAGIARPGAAPGDGWPPRRWMRRWRRRGLAAVALVLGAGLLGLLGLNALANAGQGPGASTAPATATRGAITGAPPLTPANRPPGSGQDPFASPFSAALSGTLTRQASGDGGATTVEVQATLSGGAQGTLVIQLQGQPGDDDGDQTVAGSSVTLTPPEGGPVYQGRVTGFSGDGQLRIAALLSGAGDGAGQLRLRIDLRVADGAVQGVLRGTPIAPTGAPAD